MRENCVKYKYITIIPARGGSKRFPRKNVYPFMGKPLVAHSCLTSLRCESVMRTFVSTDDEEIKKVSLEYGAEVINRPIELAGDYIPTSEVLRHAAQTLISQGVDFDYIVLLQPTNPLRPETLLDESIQIIEQGKQDSLMTVSSCHKKFGKIENNKFSPWNYYFGQRSQDMEPLYYENGLLYISSKQLILNGRIMGDNMYPMVINHIYGTVDIDTPEDLLYAEYVAKGHSV